MRITRRHLKKMFGVAHLQLIFDVFTLVTVTVQTLHNPSGNVETILHITPQLLYALKSRNNRLMPCSQQRARAPTPAAELLNVTLYKWYPSDSKPTTLNRCG